MEFLSDTDFETAKANGIAYKTAYERVYSYGWSVKDAVTTPVKKRSDCRWYKYREQCEKLGINQNTFYQRLQRGWSIEETLSIPPYQGKRELNRRPDTVLSSEALEIAAKNGITANTAKARVHKYRWSVEKAITHPVDMRFSSRREL